LHQNNYVECLNIFDSAAKCFDILATNLNILHNYFDDANRIIFRSVSSQIFRYFNKPFFLCNYFFYKKK